MSEGDLPRGSRVGIAVNYAALILIVLTSLAGYSFGWSTAVRVLFWLAVLVVVVTFFPVHLRTGLWRLTHSRGNGLAKGGKQQVLESLRGSYVVFSVTSLLLILASVILGAADQTQRLVIFCVLLYLAHTLPSSMLVWTSSRGSTPTVE
jgi:hypothetical protein